MKVENSEEDDDEEEAETAVSSEEMRVTLKVLERDHRQNGFNIESLETVIIFFYCCLRENFSGKRYCLTFSFKKTENNLIQLVFRLILNEGPGSSWVSSLYMKRHLICIDTVGLQCP